MVRLLAVAACVVALAPRVVRAADEDATARARSHFEIGRGYFRLGNYSEALREFTAGYELAPRPQFLVNLGQCHRMLRDYDHARAMFEKFLAEAPADDPERAAVEQLLEELKGMSNPPAVAPAPA